MKTRSQTRSAQPADLEIPTRANPPRKLEHPRQDNAVVSGSDGGRSRPISDANGDNPAGSEFAVEKCKNKRCKVCPKLITSPIFKSNVTGKCFKSVNFSDSPITCKSQNFIYLLTCEHCNIQYVGETTIPMNERMNIHRTGKKGCEFMISHFNGPCKGYTFYIQVITKFEGDGYDDSGEVDSKLREQRLEHEDFWIKRMRTIYPYGLNDKAKEYNQGDPRVGRLFPRLPRDSQRSTRTRNRRTVNAQTHEDFFHEVYMKFYNEPKEAFNFTRKLLDKCKWSVLKKIALCIIDGNDPCLNDKVLENFHEYILDTIDSKLYKPPVEKNQKKAPENPCVVFFSSKALEYIGLPSIFRDPEIVQLLPENLRGPEQIPVVTYRLGKTVRNKILNFKETISSLQLEPDNLNFLDNMKCDCVTSSFCDPHHRHVITGNLNIIEHNALKKLFSKGPNFREKRTINFPRARKDIISAVDTLIDNLAARYNHPKNHFEQWKNSIIQTVNNKINVLRISVNVKKTSPVLYDHSALEQLNKLQEKYVIVPIDKASNNYAFICKKFYIAKLLDEVGFLHGDSSTYKANILPPDHFIQKNVDFCSKFGYKVSDREKCLPTMYWMPKMHKNPIGSRFIVASKICSTKKLSADVSKIFKLFFNQVRNFHDKSKFYSSYNKFWVVDNSSSILSKINKCNVKKNAKSIATFDFATLYTKIPHDRLIETLYAVIDFVFKSSSKSKRKFICTNFKSAFWTKTSAGNFSKKSIKDAVHHLITECHFTIGNVVFSQIIGIPMGIDPAPFWANLFLSYFESNHMDQLIRLDVVQARRYHATYRFIDDLCTLNNNHQFENSYKTIYPPELELKIEHNGDHATFLELDISVIDNMFVYKLFDKRDAFPFFIVRMPHIESNIPSFIFYGSFKSEILRIAKNTLRYEDFVGSVTAFVTRMKNQGGIISRLKNSVSKVFTSHTHAFKSFEVSQNQLLADIF